MVLTTKNYFSREADMEYLSVSQYNSFVGTPFKKRCEARTMAKLKGEWKDEPSPAMLIGSYADTYFEGTLDDFRAEHPEIYTQKGELRADFSKALEIIRFVEQDDFWMKYAMGDGLPQVIVTGEIGGAKWKGMLDRYHPGLAIVDRKVVASIREKVWDDFLRVRINFIEAYGYIRQGAVYQELVFQTYGERLPFYIAAVSKEKVPDHEIIFIEDSVMKYALDEIRDNVENVLLVKSGVLPPVSCGECDYCRLHKRLQNSIYLSDI